MSPGWRPQTLRHQKCVRASFREIPVTWSTAGRGADSTLFPRGLRRCGLSPDVRLAEDPRAAARQVTGFSRSKMGFVSVGCPCAVSWGQLVKNSLSLCHCGAMNISPSGHQYRATKRCSLRSSHKYQGPGCVPSSFLRDASYLERGTGGAGDGAPSLHGLWTVSGLLSVCCTR